MLFYFLATFLVSNSVLRTLFSSESSLFITVVMKKKLFLTLYYYLINIVNTKMFYSAVMFENKATIISRTNQHNAKYINILVIYMSIKEIQNVPSESSINRSDEGHDFTLIHCSCFY